MPYLNRNKNKRLKLFENSASVQSCRLENPREKQFRNEQIDKVLCLITSLGFFKNVLHL